MGLSISLSLSVCASFSRPPFPCHFFVLHLYDKTVLPVDCYDIQGGEGARASL